MNAHNSGCDHQRIEDFLNSDHVGLDDPDLVDHLDSCATCRAYMERQAAEPEGWSKAAELLQPSEFDHASTAECSAATIGDQRVARSGAIQNVLDSLTPSDDPHRLGRLGGYEVSGVVGVGGMGVVLKAVDPSLDRVVAIKVMAPHLANNATARKRFSREAKAAAAVLHPNVIPIHCVSSDDTIPYLVMAYIRGGSLQKRLEGEGPLPTVEILRIGSQIAAGLAAAHEQGLVHRDIKPENILLEEGVERVALTDFGLARAVDDASVTREGAIAGTPQYMSPEQARGESVDQKSDLFSLGSVLYALCTGRPPFRADSSYGVMRRISDEIPTPIRELNPDIPEWLVRIIEKLMAKEKAERFDSASEVHELLEACLSHAQRPDAAKLNSQLLAKTKPTKQPSKSRSFVVVALTGVLFAFIAAVVYYIQTNNGTVLVEVTDPSLQVTIRDKTITMKEGNKEPLTIRAGQQKLIVQQDGSDLKFETDNFQIRRNDKVALKVELLAGQVVVKKDGEGFGAATLQSGDFSEIANLSPLGGRQRDALRNLFAIPDEAIPDGVHRSYRRSKFLPISRNPDIIGDRDAFPIIGLPFGITDKSELGNVAFCIVAMYYEHQPQNEIGVYGIWFSDRIVADKWSQKVKANTVGSPFIAKGNLLCTVWKDPGASDEAMQAVLKIQAAKLDISADNNAVRHQSKVELDAEFDANDELPSGAIRAFGDDSVFAVAIAPDGKRVATGEDKGVRIWDVESGEVLQRHPNRSTVHAVRFSPDGKQLAWGGFGNSFALVDLATARKILEPDVGICVGFFTSYSADGKRLLSDGSNSRGNRSDHALLWDIESGSQLRRFAVDGTLWRGVLTPNGKNAITCDTRGYIIFWETETGNRLGDVRVDGGSVLDLGIDATGAKLAAVSSYPVPYVAIIDVTRQTELKRIPLKEVIRSVALSGDGKLVAVGTKQSIEIYDVATGDRVQELVGHHGGCSSLAFNAEATVLLSGGFHGGAILWKVEGVESRRDTSSR